MTTERKSIVVFEEESLTIPKDTPSSKVKNVSIEQPRQIEEPTHEKTLPIWEAMMKEFDKKRNEIDAYKKNKIKETPQYRLPNGSLVEYMENNVLSVLFPAFTNAFTEAVNLGTITNVQTTFNLLDAIAQNMWNNNPKYPKRAEENLNIHEMPWAKKILQENPRPLYPKSWIFTPVDAATNIQSFYRGYLVRRRDDVQEMRLFWKALRNEKLHTVSDQV